MTLVNTPGNRWRTFILIWCGIAKQWSGNGLVSYYLGSMLKSAGITGQTNTTLITATSSMFSFACSFAFAFLPARVGRRPLLLWSMGLMWLVFSLITITTGVFVETKNKSASYASVAFIYLYSGVHNLGWTGAMMVYGKHLLFPPIASPQLTQPLSRRDLALLDPREGHGTFLARNRHVWYL
jgi:MFS family permease